MFAARPLRTRLAQAAATGRTLLHTHAAASAAKEADVVKAANAHRLKDRVAIVTASTDGIGLAIAKRLGQEGAKVVVSSRKQDNVTEAVKQLRGLGLDVQGVTCHVGNAEQRQALIKETLQHYGKLDILVSNAAVNPFMGKLLDTPEDSWDKIFDTNVKAAFLITREAMPHLVKSPNPSVVYVTSIAGFTPFAMLGAYSVSKTALLGLTKGLAEECGPLGVRVNAIAPGVIKTRFSTKLWEDESKVKKTFLHSTPLRRFGESEEIAGVAAFLCSDDAAYVTGETIVAAGGMHSRL